MNKILVLCFMCISLLVNSQSAQKSQVKNLDAFEFKKAIEQNNGILIDLRTDEEINSKGMIKGARQINFFDKNAENKIKTLDKTKTYLIYCAGGGRSSECAELMQKNGFKEIIHLEKGFDDWKRKGLAIEKK